MQITLDEADNSDGEEPGVAVVLLRSKPICSDCIVSIGSDAKNARMPEMSVGDLALPFRDNGERECAKAWQEP